MVMLLAGLVRPVKFKQPFEKAIREFYPEEGHSAIGPLPERYRIFCDLCGVQIRGCCGRLSRLQVLIQSGRTLYGSAGGAL